MGKLHTLRRAILRDVDKRRWWSGAYFWGPKWNKEPGWRPSWVPSYRKFVNSVVKAIYVGVGNADVGQGGVSGTQTGGARASATAGAKAEPASVLTPESRLPGKGPVSRGPNVGSIPTPVAP